MQVEETKSFTPVVVEINITNRTGGLTDGKGIVNIALHKFNPKTFDAVPEVKEPDHLDQEGNVIKKGRIIREAIPKRTVMLDKGFWKTIQLPLTDVIKEVGLDLSKLTTYIEDLISKEV